MVAPGTVKSRMPSALADSDHRSAESRTPLGGRPASVPASLPSSSEPGASSAPVRTAPSVSAMTRVSARPIRPPAPATIKRISDIFEPSGILLGYSRDTLPRQPIRPIEVTYGCGPFLRLRAVVTFDDHQISFRMRAADGD